MIYEIIPFSSSYPNSLEMVDSAAKSNFLTVHVNSLEIQLDAEESFPICSFRTRHLQLYQYRLTLPVHSIPASSLEHRSIVRWICDPRLIAFTLGDIPKLRIHRDSIIAHTKNLEIKSRPFYSICFFFLLIYEPLQTYVFFSSFSSRRTHVFCILLRFQLSWLPIWICGSNQQKSRLLQAQL